MSTEIKKPRKRANATEANRMSASPATISTVPSSDAGGKSAPQVQFFEGHSLTVLWRDGKPWWIAREVGEAFEYEDGSKLVDQIADEWSDEFIEGNDFVRVTGGAAAEILRAVDAGKNTDATIPRNAGFGRGARRVVLLSESGINLAAIKTRKPAGKRLRRWLASEVLPSLARSNALTTATDEQIRTAVRAEMERQFRTPESKLAELNRLSTNVGTVLADRVGASQEQVRGWALELAKGVAGFGGAGRELGYVSSRQFSAMRALLRALPSLVLLLPKRRQRGIAKALASGSSPQLTLFGPMRAALDVGPARVTVVVEPREAEGT